MASNTSPVNLTANGSFDFSVDEGMKFFIAADGSLGGGTVVASRDIGAGATTYGAIVVDVQSEFRAVVDKVTVTLAGATGPDVFIAYGNCKPS